MDPSVPGDGGAFDGSSEGIARQLERHLPQLQAFLRLRMGPELRAKESSIDLAQSACREVLENLDRFRVQGDSNFRRWLYTTALRKVKNRVEYYRAAKRDARREQPPHPSREDLASLTQVYQTLSTPSRALMQQEAMERFEAAFDKLPEHYQEVILLSRILGMTHAEIAEATGRTEVASRNVLSRALLKLTDHLGLGED